MSVCRMSFMAGWTLSLSVVLCSTRLWGDDFRPEEVFDRVWARASSEIYPKALREQFTEEKRKRLRTASKDSKDWAGLGLVINAFLSELRISHTHFYEPSDEAFYFLKAIFKRASPKATWAAPKLGMLGIQTAQANGKWIVREILEGFPAEKIGLKRGDELTAVAGKDFVGWDQLSGLKGDVEVRWRRGDKDFKANAKLTELDVQEAFFQASQQSARILEMEGKKIGYLHQWTGTHPKLGAWLQKTVVEDFADTDGMILDLRGGYGGSWWEHLDPYFADTRDYFVATLIKPDGTREEKKTEFRKHAKFYSKPMVVLINEGVRSGKEALAFLFKKTGRATLVGSTTAGFFVSGRPFFLDEDVPYVLYLSVGGVLLDGKELEGKGVTPDVEVAYPMKFNERDPQREAAKQQILKLLR